MKRENLQKQQIFSEIEELLDRISIPIRYEKGDFIGGLCTYDGRTIFILNKKLSLEQKLQVAKMELPHLNLENYYLRPLLREFLEASK